jgi:sec-independent protein translocase protein TatA
MAWDDPMVYILILGLGILLFGSNKIPELARSLGKARREFDAASRGLSETINAELNPTPIPQRVPRAAPPQMARTAPVEQPETETDPLFAAAQKEGIDTKGKTRSQIAAELANKVQD